MMMHDGLALPVSQRNVEATHAASLGAGPVSKILERVFQRFKAVNVRSREKPGDMTGKLAFIRATVDYSAYRPMPQAGQVLSGDIF